MPPKKKVERAATENISLGPQVREGELVFGKYIMRRYLSVQTLHLQRHVPNFL